MPGYGITIPDWTSNIDPFEDAADFTVNTSDFVTQHIELVNTVATDALAAADLAIAALHGVSAAIAGLPDYDVPDAQLEPNIDIEIFVPELPGTTFGRIDDFDVDNTVSIGGLPSIGTVTIPDFAPTPFTIYIPPPPIPELITTPGDGPDTPLFSYPADIVITLPDQPPLTPIVIPGFTSPVIADFTPTFPTFTEREITTLINWTEPTYTEEVMGAVKIQIATFFAGGSGIDPIIEENIFARSRDREDRTIRQQEMQATEEWANKGYTAPPGMLVKRIDNIREEGTLKKLSLNREAMLKVHQDEIDNLRFAVQQGIAAEQLYVQLFLARVERLFEAQKLSIQWQVDLYGLAVQVFTAQMEEVKVRAQVYDTQVRAALIEIEVFKALIEGEKVKADINKVLIDAYVAEIGAREAQVRMYGEQVKAVGIRAGVFETEVQAYKAEIEAYAARVGADKNRFDAYASQIRGEATKAEILDSEARAYQAHISGIETGVRAEVAVLEGAVKSLDVEIRNYEAVVRGQVGRAQVQLGQIEANVAGNNANTQRFIAQMSAEEARDKVELAAWEGTNRVNLEIFKANALAFQTRLERAIKQVELTISSEGAIGQLASTITAGAMAAMHVGASISGSGSVGASGNLGYSNSAQSSVSCSTSNTASINYETTSFAESSNPCPTLSTSGGGTFARP